MTDPGSRTPTPTSLTAAGRSPRLLAAVVVVLALVIGVVIGAVGSRRFMMQGRGEFGRRPPFGFGARGPRSHGPSDRMRQRFASELGLSPTQIVQVDSIMSRSMTQREALDDSIRPRMRALLDSTRAQIERVLTPDQRQKFEAMHARERGGGPGGTGDRRGDGGPGADTSRRVTSSG